MSTMDNKSLSREKLKSELLQLRGKIESGNDRLPIELGLPRVLSDLEHELTNDIPNKENLENGAYGIFRLVTESYEFEKSFLGQELLNLSAEIEKLISTLTI